MKLGLRDFEKESALSFEARAVKMLCRHLGVEAPPSKRDFNFDWFREFSGSKVRFSAKRVPVSIDRLFFSFTKSPGFKEFANWLAFCQFDFCALVVPWRGAGLFVFHNCWDLSGAPGYTRIVRRAATPNKGTIFESLEAFCVSLSRERSGSNAGA